MSFGLLAGIAGAFPAIQRGVDDQKARDQADEDRKFQLEQRDSARADRAFGLRQRDRQVAEQDRQDTLRRELAAVPQTREIDTRPQAVREITVDDDGNPSATQIPAMKTVAAPDWQKFKSTADVLRKNQEFEKADAYEQLASRAQFADSARRFQTVAAGAGAMSLEQLAQAAADIYNNDPLPAQIEGMKPVGGGMQFTFSNKDTGQSQSLVVKTKDELLQKLESYYSPDTYAAAIKAQRDARAKVAEEVNKPAVLRPGERRVVGPEGTVIGTGAPLVPKGMELSGYDAQGNPQYTRASGKKEDAPFKSIDDVFKAVEGFSNLKTELSGQQGAEALRLARMFSSQQPGVDPSAAASAALRAAQDPAQIKPMFDARTGKIMAGVPFEGGNFFVRPLGTPSKPGDVRPEDMKGLAAGFIGSLPEDKRAILLPAAFSKDGRAKLSQTVAADIQSPEGLAQLQAYLGRKPTQADIAAAIKSVEATTQQTLDLIALHGDPKLRSQFGEKPPAAPRPGGFGLGVGGGQPAGARTQFETMPDATLVRIAAIDGHTGQQAARAEIARRRAAASGQRELPADTAGMLNLSP